MEIKMIKMVEKQEIIIRYFRENESQRKIAKTLGINRKTVNRYIISYQKSKRIINKATKSENSKELTSSVVASPSYKIINREKRKLTNEIQEEVDQLLAINQQRKQQGIHKQLMKKIDILETLQNKGYQIGYSTICNYIRTKTAFTKEAYIKQTYQAGETCEFDWGEVKLQIGSTIKKLQMAVFSSAMSNYRYARLYVHQDIQSFQQSHVKFFEQISGVYHKMVYDNMRTVIKKFVGREKEPTDSLLQLAAYYNFRYRFCNTYSGNEKGHVERSVEYIRRKAFSYKITFSSIEQANEHLLNICNQLNQKAQKVNQGKTANVLFEEEKHYLYDSPPAFDCAEFIQLRVDKYSTITYATNKYSIPDHLVDKIVQVKVYPDQLLCYWNNEKLCSHQRQYTRTGWYMQLEHYLSTLNKKPGALIHSLALKKSNQQIKYIYADYFQADTRGFIELLQYKKKKEISIELIIKTIERLRAICPHSISVDKIISLCDRKEDAYQLTNSENTIQDKAKEQLKEWALLFPNQETLTYKNEIL